MSPGAGETAAGSTPVLTGTSRMPITECDGRLFKEALLGSLAWLTVNRDEVDALNVFPVPDGDTGTNMLLTLQSAVEDIRDEIQVVFDVASPRHDPEVIEDRLAPVLPLGASPSEPLPRFGGVLVIARHERGDPSLAPGLEIDLEKFITHRNHHVIVNM